MTQKTKLDMSGIRKLYDDSLEKHGATAAGVGWGDKQKHLLRFDKLSQLIDAGSSVSINDLGCGYGAFFDYLNSKNFEVDKFRGYDISANMIELARHRHPHQEWIVGSDLDNVADYTFASGIFNVPVGTAEGDWRTFIEHTIQEMDRHSAKGFAFNLLTTYVDYRASNLYYGDPGYYFDFCKRRCSSRVTLLHDYPLYEWTLLVRK